MKFPKPRQLTINEYPEIQEEPPITIKKLIQEIAHPAPKSYMDQYIDSTIAYVKNKHKEAALKAKLNNVSLGQNLPL